MPVFMPVQITADPPLALPGPSSAKTSTVEDTRIEIELPDGTCVRVGADVGLVTLRRIITAVRR
jgi:transposase